MVKIENSYKKLSLLEIEKFELKNRIIFPSKYKKFLLRTNGGSPKPHIFLISNEQGESSINGLFGIYTGEYEDIGTRMEVFDGRIPDGFLPIGDDPGGNLICLGINEKYYDKIYFWDHEEEADEPDMTNMYFLANDIDELFNKLYEDKEN